MEKCNNYREIEKNLDGEGMKIGIVMSRFNIDVCEGLLSACACQLKKQGVADGDIVLATVPGALEIPLVLQTMAKSGKYDALIALGAVIRGETYHFEIVSNESARGLMDLTVQRTLAIGNGILTVDTEAQAKDRIGGAHGHKGADAAKAALAMIALKRDMDRA